MPDRYDLQQCTVEDDDGNSCDAEMDRHPKGAYVEWDEYKTLLDAYQDLYQSMRAVLKEVYDPPEFS